MNDIEKWDRAEELVRRAVRQLNETLGFAEDAQHKVTFGYIGNISTGAALGSKNDERRWSVYLPHPDRVGTSDDQLGFVSSGDYMGLAALAGQVLAFRRGLTWSVSS